MKERLRFESELKDLGLESQAYTDAIFQGERGLNPSSGHMRKVLAEDVQESPHAREIFDLEKLFEEKEARKARKSTKCRRYPTTLKVVAWSKRLGERGRRFLESLRKKKKLKNAILVRGRIRVPTDRVRWLLEGFAENLTIDLAELPKRIERVNVAIELFRVLDSDLLRRPEQQQLAFLRYLEVRHREKLPGCTFYQAGFDHPDGSHHGQAVVEKHLRLSVGELFDRSGYQRMLPEEKQRHMLLTYTSFPSTIEQYIKYKQKIDDSQIPVPNLPNDLEATRLARARISVPSKNLGFLLKLALKRQRGPLWVRRITVKLEGLLRLFPTADVTIDLIRLEKTDVVVDDINDSFKSYLDKIASFPAYAVWNVFGLKQRSKLEKRLQIDLEELLSHKKPADNRQHLFLVSVNFPRDQIEAFIVPDQILVLDGFVFNRSFLTLKHKERIRIIARHIADTWRTSAWHVFQPVHKIIIEGHTDLVGADEYNISLSLKRANEVKKELRNALDRHRNVVQGRLSQRIKFVVDKRGKKDPLEDTEERSARNRRVIVALHEAPEPIRVLKDIRENVLDLMKRKPVDDVTSEVIQCVLSKITKPDVEDRYIVYPFTLDTRKHEPKRYPSVRRELLRQAFKPHAPKASTEDRPVWTQSTNRHLEFLKDLIERINEGHRKLAQNFRVSQTPIGDLESPQNKAKRLWVSKRFKNDPKSILHCFKDLPIGVK
jgi:outer membrane protein OmpA-like peptidoglycan-associated protein